MSASTPSQNEGIVITGGNVQAGAMAAGRQARAHAEVVLPEPRNLDDVLSQLGEIHTLLAQHLEELDTPHELIESIRGAQQELAQERPDKHRVLGLLQNVTAGVGSAGGLATALTQLVTAVDRLL